MVAFNVSTDLPTNLQTVEQVAAWALSVLYALHKSDVYPELDNSPLTPIITGQKGMAADETERVIYRISLPLAADYETSSNPLWEDVQAYSSAVVPARFKP